MNLYWIVKLGKSEFLILQPNVYESYVILEEFSSFFFSHFPEKAAVGPQWKIQILYKFYTNSNFRCETWNEKNHGDQIFF